MTVNYLRSRQEIVFWKIPESFIFNLSQEQLSTRREALIRNITGKKLDPRRKHFNNEVAFVI